MNRLNARMLSAVIVASSFVVPPVRAEESLQSCHDHWRALEESSRIQSAREGAAGESAKLSRAYARRAVAAIAAAIRDRSGQPPAGDSELYRSLVTRSPNLIEDRIPKDCRVIAGVGDFSDNDAMRRQRQDIDQTVQARDWAKVASLARAPAERGDAISQVVLGKARIAGGGKEQDLVEAAQWFRKAADQGNAEGQLQLGILLVNGAGVAKDPAQGIALIRKAAEANNAEAQIALATVYYNGLGVAQDVTESTRWIARAAESGNYKAQALLGDRYAGGTGVPRDLTLASMWLEIASTWAQIIKGPDDMAILGLRDRVAQALKPEEVERAKRWARECSARQFRRCVNLDAEVAAKDAAVAAKEAQFRRFAEFLSGPWGGATTRGERLDAQKVEGGKIVFGRKSCPPAGLANPADMEENEIWFETRPDQTLVQRLGVWGTGGGDNQFRLSFIGMKGAESAEFNASLGGLGRGRTEITRTADNQILVKRIDGITMERAYIRCSVRK